jgi:hypothetical protein
LTEAREPCSCAEMSNALSDDKKRRFWRWGRLGCSLRQIEKATAIRRETPSAYLKVAGIAVRGAGRPAGSMAAKTGDRPVMSTILGCQTGHHRRGVHRL